MGLTLKVMRFEYLLAASHQHPLFKIRSRKCFQLYVPDCDVCIQRKQIITFYDQKDMSFLSGEPAARLPFGRGSSTSHGINPLGK